MNTPIRPKVITLLAKFLKPLTDEGLIYVEEKNIIVSNLQYLSRHGKLLPVVVPKLIDQKSVSEMLGISLSNFQKLEKEGHFEAWFKRKYVGSAIRYKNTDIVKYILDDDK